jgi:hypothetical protein
MEAQNHPDSVELLPGIIGRAIDNGRSTCPNAETCGQKPGEYEIRNHSLMWGEGEVHCLRCGTFIRHWDSG